MRPFVLYGRISLYNLRGHVPHRTQILFVASSDVESSSTSSFTSDDNQLPPATAFPRLGDLSHVLGVAWYSSTEDSSDLHDVPTSSRCSYPPTSVGVIRGRFPPDAFSNCTPSPFGRHASAISGHRCSSAVPILSIISLPDTADGISSKGDWSQCALLSFSLVETLSISTARAIFRHFVLPRAISPDDPHQRR